MPHPAPVPSAFEEARREPTHANATGIAYMVVAVTLFSAMDAMAKWLIASYPLLQIIFVRSVVALIPLSIYLYWLVGTASALRTRHPMKHVVRSVVGLVALGCFFYALQGMPLANVVAIGFAAPLFITALSVPLLDEPVGVRRWSAVLVGFAGVLIIVQPRGEGFNQFALVALCGTFFFALLVILLRKMSRTESSAAIVFYFMVISIVLTGFAMPWYWVQPQGGDWLIFIALGIVGGLAQICMTNAFRHGEAVVVAPFDYLSILWATLIGYWVWGELPNSWVWLGVVIVMASGLYILHREAALKLPRGIARRWQSRR